MQKFTDILMSKEHAKDIVYMNDIVCVHENIRETNVNINGEEITMFIADEIQYSYPEYIDKINKEKTMLEETNIELMNSEAELTSQIEGLNQTIAELTILIGNMGQ